MDPFIPKPTPILRLQRATWRWLEALTGIGRGVFSGVWLGILSRSRLNDLNMLSYGLPNQHLSEEHNRGGLFPWEAAVVDAHFKGCGPIVVLGAGAGRECAALMDRAYSVDGFECNRQLRATGTAVFGEAFAQRCLQPMEMDRCPALTTTYGGAIIGWGMYTLIQGRSTRVEMLQDLRAATRQGAPLLVSFFIRTGSRRPFSVGATIGTALRRVRGAPAPEYGDAMAPTFAHYFTRDELESELTEGGWNLAYYDRRAYPHAVANAANRR